MKRMKRIPAVVSLVLFPAYAAVCQIQKPTQIPGFEVASIKLSSPAGGGTQIGVSPGGMFTARNVTVRTLVQQAYDLRDFRSPAVLAGSMRNDTTSSPAGLSR